MAAGMVRSAARRLLYRAADAGASLYGDFRSRRSEFLAHERTSIADARMGELVKVVGRLRGNGWEYKAPLSAVTCLWYRTVVRSVDDLLPALVDFVYQLPFVARVAPGKTITEEESVDLFVDDESGSALLSSRSAQFSLVGMRSGWTLDEAWSNTGRAGNAHRFLERYALSAGRAMMYREVVLKEGDRIAVLGRPRMELDPTGTGGFRGPPTRIVFDEPGQVLVSDEPGIF